MFGHAVLRVVFALLGYIVAVGAAAAVMMMGEWIRAYPPIASQPDVAMATAVMVVLNGFFLFWLLGTMALLPALAAIVVAEAFSLRSWVFYVAAGAAIAGLLSRLLDPARIPALPVHADIVIAGGLAGGLAYWLVAGRGAGRRLPAAVPPAA